MSDGTTLHLSHAIFAVYCGLLGVAAVSDLLRFTIPNFVSAALILLFLPVALITPWEIDWLSHLGAAGICFGVTFAFYLLGWLGAGDVKLLTAAALWAGLGQVVSLVFGMAVAGTVLILALIGARHLAALWAPASTYGGAVAVPRLLSKGEQVPYGVAIACGAFQIGLQLPYLWAMP